MLCAPLVTRDSVVGVLKIAARHPEQLTPFDAELVEHFRSQAAIAIQNLHRTESLRARVLTAERKHAMADLARSVSHDVNNALGSMLPLIQQMQADLRSGALDTGRVRRGSRARAEVAAGVPADLRRDADVFAECGAARRYGHVRRAIETASAILKYGMSRSAIELDVERSRRDSGGRMQPERSRTGVSEPADQRARGHAARRADHGHGARRRSPRRNLDRRQRLRDSGRGSATGARALLHHEGARQRSRSLDLPIGSVGGRRHADDSERAW